MRRWLLILVATLMAFGLATVAFVLWVTTTPGLLETDRVTTDPALVAAIAAAELGLDALPAGVDAVAAREGGFQDRFVQIHLAATGDGFDRLLAGLSLTRADLVEVAEPYLGPEFGAAPEGWNAMGPALTARLPSARLDHLTIAARRDPGVPERWLIFLWGFET